MSQRFLGLRVPAKTPLAEALLMTSRFSADVCFVALDEDILYSQAVGTLELLRDGEWTERVYGVASAGDHTALGQQLSMAAHLGLPGVVVPLPSCGSDFTQGECLSLSAVIVKHCNASSHTKVIVDVGEGSEVAWVRYRSLLDSLNIDPFSSSAGRWHDFASVRVFRGAHHMVSALVTLVGAQPLDVRWLGEQLSGFALSPISDSSSWHSESVSRLLTARCNPVLDISGDAFAGMCSVGIKDRVEHSLGVLGQLYVAQRNVSEDAFAGMEEELQLPLQPLGDHLPNPTYAVFEADATKYTKYQEAIVSFFTETYAHSTGCGDRQCHVVVLGAGRGPLVTSALNAAQLLPFDLSLTITIIEKNPHAVAFLRVRMAEDAQWVAARSAGTRMELAEGDGRCVASALGSRVRNRELLPVDVLVSELLGSLGDNELSPECIEGFMRSYMCSNSGTSLPRPACIPREYTSFAAPVYSGTLLDRVRDICLRGGTVDNDDPWAVFNVPFVVQSRRHVLLAPPRPVLKFSHDRDLWSKEGRCALDQGGRADNFNREATVSFVADVDGIVHGFLGYFECVLFNEDAASGDCLLSTNPETRTVDMYSWFPLFIPLLPSGNTSCSGPHPLSVRKGDSIDLHICRRHDASLGVWYEWHALVRGHVASLPMNAGGNYSRISL